MSYEYATGTYAEFISWTHRSETAARWALDICRKLGNRNFFDFVLRFKKSMNGHIAYSESPHRTMAPMSAPIMARLAAAR
jgi:hypothetical protein